MFFMWRTSMIWKRDMYISYLADHEDVGRTMFC